MPYSITIDEAVSGNIVNLNGLSQLTTIGGYLHVLSNTALTSLTGLEGVTSMGGVNISLNNALTSVTALNAVTNIGGNFSIYGNPSLTKFMSKTVLSPI